jgi:imidazolonepropionase-like amidohydrolase
MSKNSLAAFAAAWLGIAVWIPAALAETVNWTAIRGARIVPVNGPVIEKGTVLIRNGVIAAAGAQVDVPASAWVIEGNGLTIYPGLIDGLSTWGLPQTPATTQTAAARGRPATARRNSRRNSRRKPSSRRSRARAGPARPSGAR